MRDARDFQVSVSSQKKNENRVCAVFIEIGGLMITTRKKLDF